MSFFHFWGGQDTKVEKKTKLESIEDEISSLYKTTEDRNKTIS
jgi:hypothetical protein